MENDFFVDSDKLSEKALEKKHRLENDPSSRTDHMAYMEGMEQISPEIREKVLSQMESYDYSKYTAVDVRRALQNDRCSVEDFKALLSPAAEPFLEEMAEKAKRETSKHFGNTVYLFTPLYIANYCENYCIYCGFNCYNDINRKRLSADEIRKEMKIIADSGIEEILMLTGESPVKSDVKYIGEACKMAKEYFRNVGLEIYPVNSEDYRYLHECGADYVTVFQETYDSDKYETLHLMGHKRVFRENILRESFLCPVRDCGRSSIMIRSIRWMFMRDSFARCFVPIVFSCHMWALRCPHARRSRFVTVLPRSRQQRFQQVCLPALVITKKNIQEKVRRIPETSSLRLQMAEALTRCIRIWSQKDCSRY